jgi:hypothetical protein
MYICMHLQKPKRLVQPVAVSYLTSSLPISAQFKSPRLRVAVSYLTSSLPIGAQFESPRLEALIYVNEFIKNVIEECIYLHI